MICELQNWVNKRTCYVLEREYYPTTETTLSDFIYELICFLIFVVFTGWWYVSLRRLLSPLANKKFYCKKKR